MAHGEISRGKDGPHPAFGSPLSPGRERERGRGWAHPEPTAGSPWAKMTAPALRADSSELLTPKTQG